MSRPPAPVFLERRSYRRRRLGDAMRVLPVVGAMLFLEPLFWAPDAGTPARTTDGMIYIFAVWAILMLVAALGSRALSRMGEDAETSGGPEA